MAGDWIKLEHATLDKPEVLELAELLSVSHGDALLYCLRFWVWADQQMSRNCHGVRVTKKGLDALMRCPGLANALMHVGWIGGNDGALVLTNFERHNGKTAKERALTTKRKQAERENTVTEMSRSDRDKSVTREEKRREVHIRRSPKTPLPDGFALSERVISWASEKEVLNLEAHFENFVNVAKAKGYEYADWDRALMNAVLNDWAKIGRGNRAEKRLAHG